MGGEGNPRGIVQRIWIWAYEWVAYIQSGICSGEWDTQTSQVFWDTNGTPNLGQTTGPSDNQKKKKKKKEKKKEKQRKKREPAKLWT